MKILSKYLIMSDLPNNKAIDAMGDFLSKDENILRAYSGTTGIICFTDTKMMIMAAAGSLATKKHFAFYPYTKMTAFSIESSGSWLGGLSEFKIYMSGLGDLEIKIGKAIDSKKIGVFLAKTIG